MREILAKFKTGLTPDLVKRRPGPGGKQLDYIEWVTAADLLDEHAPDWSHQIKSIQVLGDGPKRQVAVIVALTVAGVTREGIGVDWLADEQGIKSAEHDALKRAAVKFGIGRDLYRGQEGMQNIRENGRAEPPAPRPPLDRSGDDSPAPKGERMVPVPSGNATAVIPLNAALARLQTALGRAGNPTARTQVWKLWRPQINRWPDAAQNDAHKTYETANKRS